jgi:hypothetical protein
MEDKMKSISRLLFLIALTTAALAVVGCSSESAQTQALYTDAKNMFDEIKRAFTLPGSQERRDLMLKILNEKWDLQVVDKLEQYLKEAPNGKYASEAKKLLDEAKNSENLKRLDQVRPFVTKEGTPMMNQGTDTTAQKSQNSQQAQPAGGGK